LQNLVLGQDRGQFGFDVSLGLNVGDGVQVLDHILREIMARMQGTAEDYVLEGKKLRGLGQVPPLSLSVLVHELVHRYLILDQRQVHIANVKQRHLPMHKSLERMRVLLLFYLLSQLILCIVMTGQWRTSNCDSIESLNTPGV
jgi:hypothetical protein